ncbi:Rap1a/Tai family immunity protein [Mesorhizobium helmanticense]|uniref:Rap1a/Tai family immunity protein n=1 Tax=Mesorhizobium helmanticense TaxID=1776423 RepID=UPI003CCA19BB
MKRLFALAFIVAGLFSPSAVAEDLNVQRLLAQCNSTAVQDWWYCLGYVGATSDVMMLNGVALNVNPSSSALKDLAICPPTAVSYGASRQAFINWAQKHPENWSASMGVGVVLALREVWPCP